MFVTRHRWGFLDDFHINNYLVFLLALVFPEEIISLLPLWKGGVT